MSTLIKGILGIVAALILFIVILGAFSSDEKVKDPGNEAALVAIRKEAKVKEAIITDVDVLYVSVNDDGTKRGGYAEYLCGILREHNAKATLVKVVKVNSTNDPKRDNAYGVLLGQARCR